MDRWDGYWQGARMGDAGTSTRRITQLSSIVACRGAQKNAASSATALTRECIVQHSHGPYEVPCRITISDGGGEVARIGCGCGHGHKQT